MQVNVASNPFTAPVDAGRKNRKNRQNQGPQDGYRPNEYQEQRGPRGPQQQQRSNRGRERAQSESSRYSEIGAAGVGGTQAAISVMAASGKTYDLKVLADKAMTEKGLTPTYSSEAAAFIKAIQQPAFNPEVKDLRHLNWCSVDNGYGEVVTSKDLDQLSASEDLPNGFTRVYVAIADVDALMPKNSPPDKQAQKNTTTVYTADKIYPMIDPHFSENLTSMNPGVDRQAMVTEMIISPEGEVTKYDIYPAMVNSKVALNYDSIGKWLEDRGERPKALDGRDEVAAALQSQSRAAQALKEVRRRNGSLQLESQEAKANMEEGAVKDLSKPEKNLATELIENLMVASNGCASKFLTQAGFPTIQRIVREPKNWDKIVDIAAEKGYDLPAKPDSAALEQFLEGERASDPLRFPDLSLNVVKLLGRGEYVVQFPGEEPVGHFGLAVKDYSHSTAPNRRYPDVITQRLLKAAQACVAAGITNPTEKDWGYSKAELSELTTRCTEQEGNAQKVERQIQKSAAAMMLQSRIGETFDAIVSGANDKGTWVRLLEMPVEGKLDGKARMGQPLTVRLTGTNVEKGFIDFEKA